MRLFEVLVAVKGESGRGEEESWNIWFKLPFMAPEYFKPFSEEKRINRSLSA